MTPERKVIETRAVSVRREGDRTAVRRPLRLKVSELVLCETTNFGAVGVDDIEICDAARTSADDETFAVWRPTRSGHRFQIDVEFLEGLPASNVQQVKHVLATLLRCEGQGLAVGRE